MHARRARQDAKLSGYRGRVPVAGRRVGAILSGGNVDLVVVLEMFEALPEG